VIKLIMRREIPNLIPISFPVVDVRDVAQAHLNAITEEKAANQRFILVESCPKLNEIA
jgi:hypothetical protein